MNIGKRTNRHVMMQTCKRNPKARINIEYEDEFKATAKGGLRDELVAKGYRLKIYDAYRPQMAVTNFVEWAEGPNDTRMKQYFYPELDKTVYYCFK